jgi:hypothetical protein
MSQNKKTNYTTSKSSATSTSNSSVTSKPASTSQSPDTSKSASTKKSPVTSKSASTFTPATSSTPTKSSKIDALKKRYENIQVPESYLGPKAYLEQEEVVPQNQDFAQTDLYDATALAAGMIFDWLLLYGKFAFSKFDY